MKKFLRKSACRSVRTEIVECDDSFEELAQRIQTAGEALQQDALVAINRSVTARAWLTGHYIVEYEQHGKARAEYGDGLLKRLAKRLGKAEYAISSLKNARLFYLTYPELSAPVSEYLAERFTPQDRVRLALPRDRLIGYTPCSQSRKGAKGYTPCSLSKDTSIVLFDGEDVRVSPWAMFNRMSYSHIRELLWLKVEIERTFYAFETIRGCWSVKELHRQIGSQYARRCGWAKDPHKFAAVAQAKAEKLDARDFIKQDTVLEFLGLDAKPDWREGDLEQGIYDKLRDFILEVGEGFCFEARQRKILIDDVYEWVDLVFYHRILKCHVLIELKPKKLNYKDIAQLSLYMSYYRKHKMTAGDNPPIGILLCTGVGKETAEYLAPFTDPQLFLSTYQLQLPSKEKFTEFLKKENAVFAPTAKKPSAKGKVHAK